MRRRLIQQAASSSSCTVTHHQQIVIVPMTTQIRTHRGGYPIIGHTKKQIASFEEELPGEQEAIDNVEKFIKENELFKSRPNAHSEKVTKYFYDKKLSKFTKDQSTLNPPRKPFTKSDALHQLDKEVTGIYRGGYSLNDDATQVFTALMTQSEGDDAQAPTWRTLYEFIENVRPRMIHSRAQPENRNSSEWFYDVPPSIVNEKPGDSFSFNPASRRRRTSYSEYDKRNEIKEQVMELPLFRHRPPDPFAYKPHLTERISYKNPRQLLKFCSVHSGKILPVRFTGVRLRTQNKLRREVMKARHLGLLSHSGNPEFNNPVNQLDLTLLSVDDMNTYKKNQAQNNQLDIYLKNLQNGILNNGTSEWSPPRHVTNPRISVKQQKAQLRGHLPEQMKKKKELLIQYRMENELLKSEGLEMSKYPSQVLRELEEREDQQQQQ